MKILHVIDMGAWVAARLIGLCQALFGELISMFYHPNPCRKNEYKDFNTLHSMMFGGWMLFHSHKPEDLPRPISERALLVGRLALGVFAISTIADMARSII